MAQGEKMKQVLEMLETGVRDFFTSDRFQDYLTVMSRFHEYSLNNQVLIASQMPEATHVAGFASWMRNFERHVKKGEKAITILAPSKQLIDVETDEKDEFGNAVIAKKEILTFRPVSVFDVSQTEGKPLPELVPELDGSVENYEDMMRAVSATAPYRIDIRAVESKAKGWCDFTSEVIVIKEGMSQAQTLKTAIHETAHGRIHGGTDKSRARKEVEAESIAYVVCSHFGLDTSDYSFGYVASWAASQDEQLLKECMQTIRDESKAIIDTVMLELAEPGKIIRGVSREDIKKTVSGQVEEITGTKAGRVDIVDACGPEGEKTKVTVTAAYDADISEYSLKDMLEKRIKEPENIHLSIVPVNMREAFYPEPVTDTRNRTDMSWPMVTVLAGDDLGKIIPGEHMNIYEATGKLQVLENAMRLAGKEAYVKIAVSFTYLGMAHKINDTVHLGKGKRNILDYLDVSPDVCTYLKRHVQLLETMEKAGNENAVGKTGHRRQEQYEDMIYSWAEEMRVLLNYEANPNIRKPPEYDPKILEQYKNWEVAR